MVRIQLAFTSTGSGLLLCHCQRDKEDELICDPRPLLLSSDGRLSRHKWCGSSLSLERKMLTGSSNRFLTAIMKQSLPFLRLRPKESRFYHPSPVRQRQVEVFVDASGWGIGVVRDGRCLSWQFTRSSQLPRHQRTKEIDSFWAEMFAAEIGLDTVVQDGASNATVVVRSDNLRVVSVLKRCTNSSFTNIPKNISPGVRTIIQRIGSLCSASRIKLDPYWISGKDNPANKPSRGGLSPGSRPMSGLEVPSHLKDFIRPIVSSNDLPVHK